MTRALGLVAATWLAGCGGGGLDIPEDASIRYDDRVAGTSLPVTGPLSDLIIARIRSEPERAEEGASMGLDTREYLLVGNLTFQIEGDALVLVDDWGVRIWRLEGMGAKLDSLSADR